MTKKEFRIIRVRHRASRLPPSADRFQLDMRRSKRLIDRAIPARHGTLRLACFSTRLHPELGVSLTRSPPCVASLARAGRPCGQQSPPVRSVQSTQPASQLTRPFRTVRQTEPQLAPKQNAAQPRPMARGGIIETSSSRPQHGFRHPEVTIGILPLRLDLQISLPLVHDPQELPPQLGR